VLGRPISFFFDTNQFLQQANRFSGCWYGVGVGCVCGYKLNKSTVRPREKKNQRAQAQHGWLPNKLTPTNRPVRRLTARRRRLPNSIQSGQQSPVHASVAAPATKHQTNPLLHLQINSSLPPFNLSKKFSFVFEKKKV
jgi:hypothetical protein